MFNKPFGPPAVSLIGVEGCSFSFKAPVVSTVCVLGYVCETECYNVHQTHELAHGENLIRENSAVRCIRQRYALKGIWF